MEALLSPERMTRDIEALHRGDFLAKPGEIVRDAFGLFRPPERISTLECAEKYRKIRTTEGGALVPYDRWRTPYNIEPQDALDDPAINVVVMIKPSRSGGTAICENHLFKRMMFGPMGDVGWYLGSDDAVKDYTTRVVSPMFEDHPELQAKVGKAKGDDTRDTKRVAGHLLEYLAAKDANWRNREFVFGVLDEPDGWSKYSESPEVQLEGRQKNVGNRRKGVILSHPDKGWGAGVAASWESSSRGIYVMRCPECERFAAAHATKFWPDVEQFTLWYQKDRVDTVTGEVLKPREQLGNDERLDMAEHTAGMQCPHCRQVLDDEQRFAMIDEAGREEWWMHRGQRLDPDEGIQGEREPNQKAGYYIHGLMLKNTAIGELARGLEEALIKYERSGGSKVATKRLREYMSKQLGEIFEGKKDIEGVTAAGLRKRAKVDETPEIGICPLEAMFITAAVDVGDRKFDVSFRGWDLENRSWWLDRLTIRQRVWEDGRLRDIATRERIEDWEAALVDDVIMRTFPIAGTRKVMPVAVVMIDTGNGGVTHMGREFAARCFKRGIYWGAKAKWPRVQLLKGSSNASAPAVPPKPRLEDKEGRRFPAGVKEWTLGVHELKELTLERLAINDGGPGQCYFANGISRRYFEEYFNEPLIDGKFERQGDNESFDLFGYEEAGRLILGPDRKDLWVGGNLPVWATPVEIVEDDDDEPGAHAAAKPKPSIFDRYNALNSNTRNR